MVGVLMDQVNGIEDMWEDILAVIRCHSIDTRKDALFTEWSRLMVSTRKIVHEALGVLDQFHIIFPWDKDPDLNETNELFFSAGENENNASLDDSSATGEDEADTMGTCQGVDEAKNEAINEYAEFYDDNNEDCHVTEVVQSWTRPQSTGNNYGGQE